MGRLSTASPDLIVAGNVVKVRCYPVTVRAFSANPDEGRPADVDARGGVAEPDVRESTDVESKTGRQWKGGRAGSAAGFRQVFAADALSAGRPVGKGYTIYPVGLTFHLTAEGVKAGRGRRGFVPDLRIEKNRIDIPLYAYHIHAEKGGNNRVIVPGVEQYFWAPYNQGDQLTAMVSAV